MLNRFHVENYKCLRDVTVPLTPIHVLIGQNDAGKSSLLEALYAFFRSSQFVLPEAFSGHWLGDDLVYENAPEPHVTLEGTWDDFGEYGLRVGFAKAAKRTCSIIDEWYRRATAERKSIRSTNANRTAIYQQQYEMGLGTRPTPIPNLQDVQPTPIPNLQDLQPTPMPNLQDVQPTSVPMGKADSEIEQVLGKLLDGAHLYRLDPRLMAIPSELSPQRRFRLDPDGFGLAGLLDDILGHDLELTKLRNEFCGYFPQFCSMHVETEPAIRRAFRETGRHDTGEVSGKGIHFETQGGRVIRAQQASDGAILFLGFLALANLPHPPRLLLIEEPETGIYPERLRQVIELLRKMTQEGGGTAPQIVFTTHSPYVLSCFQPEEVTFMSRGADGAVRARPLRDAPHIQERLEGFYLGELWYNLSEEELFADA